MGEKLELRLKSPVGAEPAVYPWPLPVYVSVPAGRLGLGVARFRGSAPAAVAAAAAGLWPFPARARGYRCPDVPVAVAAATATAAGGLEPRVSGLCGPESEATLWAGLWGLRCRGSLASVWIPHVVPSCCHLRSPHTVVSVSSCCLFVLSSRVLLGCHLWCWWEGAKGTLAKKLERLAVHVILGCPSCWWHGGRVLENCSFVTAG